MKAAKPAGFTQVKFSGPEYIINQKIYIQYEPRTIKKLQKIRKEHKKYIIKKKV